MWKKLVLLGLVVMAWFAYVSAMFAIQTNPVCADANLSAFAGEHFSITTTGQWCWAALSTTDLMPDPTTFLLLGLGLLGFAALRTAVRQV